MYDRTRARYNNIINYSNNIHQQKVHNNYGMQYGRTGSMSDDRNSYERNIL